MHDELTGVIEDMLYDEAEELDLYTEYTPRKMTKKEFVKEMLRLQEENRLFAK